MKKRWAAFSMVLVLGFMLGGAVVARNADIPFMKAFLAGGRNQTVEASPQTDVLAKTSTYFGPPMNIADMVEKAGSAVVNVEAQVKVNSGYDPFMNDPFFRQFFGRNYNIEPQSRYETGIGTGFLISQDGYIITNQHVINNAVKVSVQLPNKKQKLTAQVVGQDYELDLAVLKIEGSGYPTLPMGDSDKMRVGDWVVAIGEPYGLDHTVTTGVVSAKGRPITIEDRNYKNLIQTDAAINPGNSGGPLLNMAGQVIGINTAVNAQAQGIGFAIPINTARDVLKDLMSGNKIKRAYMGILMEDIDEEVISKLQLPSNSSGVLVMEVLPGSPAEKVGLKYLDIIQKIDGKVMNSAADVQNFIAQKKVGDRIALEVFRNGNRAGILMVLGEKP